MSNPERPSDSHDGVATRHAEGAPQAPLLLQENGCVVRLLFPFAFEPTSTFARVCNRVLRTRVDAAPYGASLRSSDPARDRCWRPYTPTASEYVLPHVNGFLGAGPPEARLGFDPYVSTFRLHSAAPGAREDNPNPVDDRYRKHVFGTGRHGLHVVARGVEGWCLFVVDVSPVDLYLFQSGVGLLAFDVTPPTHVVVTSERPVVPWPPPEDAWTWTGSGPEPEAGDVHRLATANATRRRFTLDDLVTLNRALRRRRVHAVTPLYRALGTYASKHTDVPDVDRYTRVYTPFSLGAFARGLLTASIGPSDEATGDRRTTEAWPKATWRFLNGSRVLAYTAAVLDTHVPNGARPSVTYDDVAAPLYWLRHGFTPRYRPTASDLAVTSNPEVLQTFENVVYGLSSEGVATLAWEVRDRPTPFIRDQFVVRATGGHFQLYLLVLHQRFACMRLAQAVGTALHTVDLRRQRRQTRQHLLSLREQIFEFFVRSWFAEVSDLRLYTRLYTHLQTALRTAPLLDEVKSEVEEYDEYRSRQQDARGARLANALTWVFFPVVVLVSLLPALVDFNAPGVRTTAWWTVGGLTGLYYAVVGGRMLHRRFWRRPT
jgi:hypothetical protein